MSKLKGKTRIEKIGDRTGEEYSFERLYVREMDTTVWIFIHLWEISRHKRNKKWKKSINI